MHFELLSIHDAYAASQGAGFSSLKRSARAGQLRSFLNSAVGVFPISSLIFLQESA